MLPASKLCRCRRRSHSCDMCGRRRNESQAVHQLAHLACAGGVVPHAEVRAVDVVHSRRARRREGPPAVVVRALRIIELLDAAVCPRVLGLEHHDGRGQHVGAQARGRPRLGQQDGHERGEADRPARGLLLPQPARHMLHQQLGGVAASRHHLVVPRLKGVELRLHRGHMLLVLGVGLRGVGKRARARQEDAREHRILEHADPRVVLAARSGALDRLAVKPQGVVVKDDDRLDGLAARLERNADREREPVAGDDVRAAWLHRRDGAEPIVQQAVKRRGRVARRRLGCRRCDLQCEARPPAHRTPDGNTDARPALAARHHPHGRRARLAHVDALHVGRQHGARGWRCRDEPALRRRQRGAAGAPGRRRRVAQRGVRVDDAGNVARAVVLQHVRQLQLRRVKLFS
mmetsp:Transcript_35677/g.105430  ORF Transcript_35677/g.105430 Transcript_35677/m.105430 type:complete len:403 (-) Transcript_35677:2115-3323(-)